MRRMETRLQCLDYFHLIGLLMLLFASRQSNVAGIRASPWPRVYDFQPSSISEMGGNFAKGIIDLGGLTVTQSSKFKRVWRTHKGGPNDQGAAFYEPSSLPDGYFMLGHYSHAKNKTSYGRVLVVRDDGNGAVAKPVRYNLLWSIENSNIKQNGVGYVWQPVPPKGYKALGHIVTVTPKMPSLDKVRCVRSDFVEKCSDGEWIWGEEDNGVNIFEGKSDSSFRMVAVGTFKVVQSDPDATPIHCLKNNKAIAVNSAMPSMDQIKTLMATYGPMIYFHSEDEYRPSSVDWFFNNGALLYQQGNEANPTKIEPAGSNLPQGASNDGAFWIDLPTDENARGQVMKGRLMSAKGYLHVKPMLGGTVTDLAIWLFYPYNGPATAKVLVANINLKPIGSHVGDWEHVTLRINNLDGKLQSVYFAQHGGGQWVNAPDLEYATGNKPIAYSSKNGHAMFPHGGLVLQGNNKRIGIRNDMEKSDSFIDIGAHFEIVSAEHLGIIEPPWLNFFRQWGPKLNYNIQDVLHSVEKALLFNDLKKEFEKFVNGLPSEILGQEGPTGPKEKGSWTGDENFERQKI